MGSQHLTVNMIGSQLPSLSKLTIKKVVPCSENGLVVHCGHADAIDETLLIDTNYMTRVAIPFLLTSVAYGEYTSQELAVPTAPFGASDFREYDSRWSWIRKPKMGDFGNQEAANEVKAVKFTKDVAEASNVWLDYQVFEVKSGSYAVGCAYISDSISISEIQRFLTNWSDRGVSAVNGLIGLALGKQYFSTYAGKTEDDILAFWDRHTSDSSDERLMLELNNNMDTVPLHIGVDDTRENTIYNLERTDADQHARKSLYIRYRDHMHHDIRTKLSVQRVKLALDKGLAIINAKSAEDTHEMVMRRIKAAGALVDEDWIGEVDQLSVIRNYVLHGEGFLPDVLLDKIEAAIREAITKRWYIDDLNAGGLIIRDNSIDATDPNYEVFLLDYDAAHQAPTYDEYRAWWFGETTNFYCPFRKLFDRMSILFSNEAVSRVKSNMDDYVNSLV